MKAGVPLVAVFVATLSSSLVAMPSRVAVLEATSMAEGGGASPATAESNAGARRKQPPSRRPETAENLISPFEAECMWIGKRIVNLLRREDVDTAHTFDRFYAAFGCPIVHLGKAFGCVVASESEREAIDERIDRCWADPYTRLFPPLPPKTRDTPLPQEQGRRRP